jgi:hypothetical protein
LTENARIYLHEKLTQSIFYKRDTALLKLYLLLAQLADPDNRVDTTYQEHREEYMGRYGIMLGGKAIQSLLKELFLISLIEMSVNGERVTIRLVTLNLIGRRMDA